MRILDGQVHLTYCSNIHPGETWAQTRANVVEQVTAVKAALAPDRPFGVGLRLSAAAADELLGQPGELDRFADTLDELGLYVFTLNGFPYGRFHGAPVKQAVYRPDWREAERLRYTEALIEILARLLPDGVEGSISTVPGGFRPDTRAPEVRERIAEQLIRAAAALWRRRESGDPRIALAVEPEPCCMLETTLEAVMFFEASLFGAAAVARMAGLTGLDPAKAELALREHLGLCFDACHAAVEFEHPRASLASLRAAGIRIAKLQVTTGLEVEPVDAAAIAALRAFDDPVYLHQVVAERDDGELWRFVDLPEALAAHARGELDARRWRVHYHVPVFQSQLPPFRNTDAFLAELLDEILAAKLCSQLELETYTWSVLPDAYRNLGLTEAIVRELRWVLDRTLHENCCAPVPD